MKQVLGCFLLFAVLCVVTGCGNNSKTPAPTKDAPPAPPAGPKDSKVKGGTPTTPKGLD